MDEAQAAPRAVRRDGNAEVSEEMRRASEQAAWGGSTPPEGLPAAEASATQDTPQPGKLPDLSKLD
jgi:hypothetical protein